MKKQTKKVVLGGTFEVLHKGHMALLKKAFKLGQVSVGLTSDAMVKRMKNRTAEKFVLRKKELAKLIKEKFKTKPIIKKIEDKFGFAVRENFDYIVVSPETYNTAVLINKARGDKKKKLMEIIEVGFVLAEDGKPMSSTRILNGEIDKNGKLLKLV